MGRITPAGVITEYPIPTPNAFPRAIALGGDGNIWFGEFGGGKIGEITPQGMITEYPIPTRTAARGPGRRTRRQHLVLGVQRRQDRADHPSRRHHRVSAAAPQLGSRRHHRRRRRAHVVRRALGHDGRPQAGWQPGGPHHDAGRGHRVPAGHSGWVANQHRGGTRPQHLVHARRPPRARDGGRRRDRVPAAGAQCWRRASPPAATGSRRRGWAIDSGSRSPA